MGSDKAEAEDDNMRAMKMPANVASAVRAGKDYFADGVVVCRESPSLCFVLGWEVTGEIN